MTTDIRIAVDDDLPAITAIYNQAIALQSATADTSPVTLGNRKLWLQEHPPDRHPVFVAASDGRVVGWCSLSAYRPGRMALRHTAEISYYVDENFRQQRIGSALIAHAIEQSPGLDIKTLFAILLDINKGSTRILENFGFEQWGHLPGVADFDGRECGHLYYGRRVAE
ncbi:MAG: GNAT family N-acetyltransferase [Gammaproteobacteria bacterium]